MVYSRRLFHGLKGQCHHIFDFRYFHESVSPKPLSIPIFEKFEMILTLYSGLGGRWFIKDLVTLFLKQPESILLKLFISLEAHRKPMHCNSYLWANNFHGPVRNAFNARKSITRASGSELGPGNRDFFGPCEWHGAVRRVPIESQNSRDFQGPIPSRPEQWPVQ